MLVGSKVVKQLQNKLFNKLNNPRSALGQKFKKIWKHTIKKSDPR